MCIVESFCQFEVRAHAENGFLLKSFSLIYACIQESYFCIIYRHVPGKLFQYLKFQS